MVEFPAGGAMSTGRTTTIVVLATTLLSAGGIVAQESPTPIWSGCFALTIDGEGPEWIPDQVRIDVFEPMVPPPTDRMPNAWGRDAPQPQAPAPVESDDVWVATRHDYGLAVERRVVMDDTREYLGLVFRRSGDRLEGIPTMWIRLGETRSRALDFTVWASSSGCGAPLR